MRIDPGVLLFGLDLLMVCLAVLFEPFRQARGVRATSLGGKHTRVRQASREALMALRDLETDRGLGKVSEEDYGLARAALIQEAAEALARVEERDRARGAPRI